MPASCGGDVGTLGHGVVVTVEDVHVGVRLEGGGRGRDGLLAQPVGVLREDDVGVGEATVGEARAEAVAAVLGGRSALETADLGDLAGGPAVVRAPLGGVLAGGLADGHVVGADEHGVVGVDQVAVEDDDRDAGVPGRLDRVVQGRRLVGRDDEQVDALREQVLDVADLVGVVLGGVLEDDLELRIGLSGGGDLAVHGLAPGFGAVGLRHADDVLVLGRGHRAAGAAAGRPLVPAR